MTGHRIVVFPQWGTGILRTNCVCGWEDADVHGDSEAKRTKALQMGANIVRYAFSGA